MTKEERHEEIKAFVDKCINVMEGKGNDYADVDVLSNFKYAANIVGVTPELQCLSLIATKVARLGVLLNSNSKPNNESIEDSILDLTCYSILLHLIKKEKNNLTEKGLQSKVDEFGKEVKTYKSSLNLDPFGNDNN